MESITEGKSAMTAHVEVEVEGESGGVEGLFPSVFAFEPSLSPPLLLLPSLPSSSLLASRVRTDDGGICEWEDGGGSD